ncbi:atpase family associated with various cellular activities domain-containing protein, partial [Cystoisospora suis]
ANLRKSILDTSQEDLDIFGPCTDESHGKGGSASHPNGAGRADAWTRIRFSLQFFHAIVQERRSFGPLGWNVGYHFSDSDLEASIALLRSLFAKYERPEDFDFVPLQYLVGNVNYGGRITDDWDRRCLENLLALYVSPEVVLEVDSLSHLGIERIRSAGTIEALMRYVDLLPGTGEDQPEIFGLHPNALLRLRQEGGNALIQAVLSVSSRETTSSSRESSEGDQALQFASLMKQKLPSPIRCKGGILSFTMEESRASPAHPTPNISRRGAGEDKSLKSTTPTPGESSKGRSGAAAGEDSRLQEGERGVHKKPDSLAIFLSQEAERFNALIQFISDSLHKFELAVKGLTAPTPEHDDMHTAILNNQVPSQWANQAYPSLKPLGSWYEDLLQRVDTLRRWADSEKPPNAFWLPGFFFPQGFLTSVLQNYARKTSVPIDGIGFNFYVMPVSRP